MLQFVRQAGQRYWPQGPYPRDTVATMDMDLSTLGKAWCKVALPTRFASLGVEGTLWVDAATIAPGDGETFDRCDWYFAAFAHLSASAEWQHERAHGPIHSYALRLRHVPPQLYDNAWANRILLLLRAREAAAQGTTEEALFGPLPAARIHITHDVDAIDKTWPIRLKQGVFELFNALRYGRLQHLRKAMAMICQPTRYDYLDTVADKVAAAGLRSAFHLYARPATRSLKLWLMDPGYRLADPRIMDFVQARTAQGFSFGLHPSFDHWCDAAVLQRGCAAMQQAFGLTPTHIRQHWLRFSLRDTWRAQASAGFTQDYTFGFNERPGFRSGSALNYTPWDFVTGTVHSIHACPTMAMDSQFYAYQSMTATARKNAMAALVNEVKAVHGEAAVLWHPHSFARDYGWSEGFDDMLALIGNAA